MFPVATLMYISFHSLLPSDVDNRGNGKETAQHSTIDRKTEKKK